VPPIKAHTGNKKAAGIALHGFSPLYLRAVKPGPRCFRGQGDDNRLAGSVKQMGKATITFDVNNVSRYYLAMSIRSFRCPDTQALFERRSIARFANIQAVARRKLEQLHMAGGLDDLRIPPGNRLEKLFGDRDGQWSIRINSQWRVCFVWTGTDAEGVEIVDYH
jgi:proteic killer suppression protein